MKTIIKKICIYATVIGLIALGTAIPALGSIRVAMDIKEKLEKEV